MAENDFFDELETRDPLRRERMQFAALVEQLENAKEKAPAFGKLLDGIDPEDVTDRAALARLPVLRKSELIERQKEKFEDRDQIGRAHV